MVEERLEAYHKHNGYLPAHILFYRDGVGEAQYGMVLEEELPQVRSACAKLVARYGGVSPMITLLVVGKRHHVRFFPDSDQQPSHNLPSGTVVDRGVIDGIVDGTGRLAQGVGLLAGRVQTGQLNTYAFVILVGVLAVLGAYVAL